VWKKVAVQEANGSFDKNFPLSLNLLTIPGRGIQPAYCCSKSSEKSQVTGFDFKENFGSIVTGHHNCNHGACPACYKHWLLSETFYAIAYLESIKALHPGCDIYQLRFFFRKQEGVTRNDISDAFGALNRHCTNPKKGLYGGVSILNHFQVKKFVEDKINQCYERDYEEFLTRTKMYWAATDLDYLHHIGFYNFHDWREAVDLFWHIHVFVVADHYPSELYLHGNMKKSAAKFLHGGPEKEISFNIPYNNSTTTSTTRPDGSPRHWVKAKVKDHTCPYEGADLARSLYYCFSHCTLSNTQGLEFKAFHRFGECYTMGKLDFDHDEPWIEEEFRLDLATGEEVLTSVQKYPDPRVTSAYSTLQLAYPHIHRKGEFIYPGDEKAPPFNEALPRRTPYTSPLTRINVRIFQLRTIYKDGIRIPAEGSEFTYKRRDAFISMIRLAEEDGLIPIFPVKLSTSIEKAFAIWDKRCLDPKLRGKDRLLYSTDFEGFEDFKKAGFVIDLGFISKAAAYKFPSSEEFEKFRALNLGFYHAGWYSKSPSEFMKILHYSLEPAAGLGTWESASLDTELEIISSAMKKPHKKHKHLGSKSKKRTYRHTETQTKAYDSTLQDYRHIEAGYHSHLDNVHVTHSGKDVAKWLKDEED